MEDMKSIDNNQGKELRELLQEVNNNNVDENVTNESLDDQQNFMEDKKVIQTESEDKTLDVLNLPPRKVTHSHKKKRTHLKLSRPFIRLTLVVVLLLIVIGLLFFYGDIVN
jgi:hypothetical protein